MPRWWCGCKNDCSVMTMFSTYLPLGSYNKWGSFLGYSVFNLLLKTAAETKKHFVYK